MVNDTSVRLSYTPSPPAGLTNVSVWRFYLSIHEQMSHQSHGLPQRVSLSGDEGLILISQATGTGHHELADLVVQAVERLNGCKGSKEDGSYILILFLALKNIHTGDNSSSRRQLRSVL